MDLADYRRMDPHLLYGILNMKLRNEYADLDDLVRGLHLEPEVPEQRMAEAGYVYVASVRQFRARG